MGTILAPGQHQDVPRDHGQPAVALVSMPLASLPRPSMGLGLLQAVLREQGIPCRSFYLNLDFAELTGTRRYQAATHLPEFLAGDWLFAEAAFGGRAPPADLYLASLARAWGPPGASVVEGLRWMRWAARDFVARAAGQVLAWRPTILGCTTGLQQTVAALALLREVHRRAPEVLTMLGGAGCETRMGLALHRNFPWVDFLVSGEADGLLPDLCRAVARQGRALEASELPAGVLGPGHRRTGYPEDLPRILDRDLDALPDPDFDDYFARLRGSPLAEVVRPGLPLETSRGCWWGALHHCTFCGLNGSSLAYRSRAPEALLQAVDRQVRRYGVRRVFLVDNILDHGYLRTVVPALEGRGLTLFTEIKSNLTPEQMALLRRAGLTWMQPGIESLHSGHLRLMDKGVRAWQNLVVLRTAREQGIRVSWILLWGFPGEEDAWFSEVADLVPSLEHLQPPLSLLRIRFDRYSVYQSRPRDHGLELEPAEALRCIYPLPESELADLAYSFRDRRDPAVFRSVPPGERSFRCASERPGIRRLAAAVAHWTRAHLRGVRPLLHVQDDGDALQFLDSRRAAAELRFRLEGPERALYLACEEAPHRGSLAARAGVDPAAAEVALEILLRRRIVVALDDRVLPLALRGVVPPLPRRGDYPGGAVVGEIPARTLA